MNTPRPIAEVAAELGLAPEHLLPYGHDKGKVRLEALKRQRPNGRLVLVSAITPTNAGEGKTTTSIGLAQGLRRLGEKVCLALREPSLGPTFGKKGGATGGGRSSLVPSEDINLHFTGDFHAVTSANNLLAALVDNHIYFRKEPEIDPRRVLWRRVLDLNDRALRHTVIGLGGRLQGVPRETGFDITPASEIMAILCLASDEDDLRRRLEKILVGFTYRNEPVFAAELEAVGSMMVLLRDALLPNLVQSVEGVPAFVHGGPFANIAHGCNSVLATRMALAHSDWAITEAGFGFDLGAEKFFDIKCQSADLDTAAVVLVATVRALKRHGGVSAKDLTRENVSAVRLGLPNLEKHLQNIRTFGETPIVALNRFAGDTVAEIEVVREACEQAAVPFAVSDHFEHGGSGAEELARTLMQHVEVSPSRFQALYDWHDPIRDKIEKVARTMYGASEVKLSKLAVRQMQRLEELGFSNLPICMAKAPTSLTDDPLIAGRPETDFAVTVSSFELAAGAGFVIPLLGEVMRMPGLPRQPQAAAIDLLNGKVKGIH